MRDFRDAKAIAQTLRAALAAKGLKISISESLELIAAALGASDWNTLAAAIKAAPKGPVDPPPAAEAVADETLERIAKAFGAPDWVTLQARLSAGVAREPPRGPVVTEPRRSGQHFSAGLAAALHSAVAHASQRRHEYTTLEHLLLALTDDPDAAAVMEACRVDVAAIRSSLVAYVDNELGSLVKNDGKEPVPTAGFHRVIQRAMIHVQSSGREAVTGANVLVAIFSERESRACHTLEAQGMTRYDAVNFIAHGVRKGDAAA